MVGKLDHRVGEKAINKPHDLQQNPPELRGRRRSFYKVQAYNGGENVRD